mmetsp:Transcript_166221/g.533692  ORF Transcript_166221/g.533692 Transcript_166221/m.533692 type:complete len:210 (-) Transcript_166221:129-758(-)
MVRCARTFCRNQRRRGNLRGPHKSPDSSPLRTIALHARHPRQVWRWAEYLWMLPGKHCMTVGLGRKWEEQCNRFDPVPKHRRGAIQTKTHFQLGLEGCQGDLLTVWPLCENGGSLFNHTTQGQILASQDAQWQSDRRVCGILLRKAQLQCSRSNSANHAIHVLLGLRQLTTEIQHSALELEELRQTRSLVELMHVTFDILQCQCICVEQ